MNLEDRPHFVYRLFGAADELLYVGCTSDLRRRSYNHSREQPWWDEVEGFSIIGPFVGEGAKRRARAVEAHIIRTEAPRENIWHSTTSKRFWHLSHLRAAA